MHLASRLVQNDHAYRRGPPFDPLDKCYRGGGVPCVGVHFLNDRPRSIEELDAEPHPSTPEKTIDLGVRMIRVGHFGRRRIARHQHSGRRVEPDRVACSLGN